MIKYTYKFTFLILFLLGVFHSPKVNAGVLAPATKYFNTVYAVMLCESGSTLSSCLNPVTVGTHSAGKTFDIGSVDAGAVAGTLGNLGILPFGKTYTHGQVVLDRTFTLAGSDGSCQTESSNDAGTKTNMADGSAGSSTTELQKIMVPNSTGMTSQMNGTPNKDASTVGDSAATVVAAGDDYIKYRWAFTDPFTPTPKKLPTMKISFDLSEAIEFNGTCGNDDALNDGISPGKPSITNTFE